MEDCQIMFNQLGEKFDEAERTTKIQAGTIEEIGRIIKELRQEEKFWHGNNSVDAKDAFALYHAVRNARLVAQKLKIRVEIAPQANDNPAVAADGSKVIPTLNMIVQKGEEYKSKRIDEHSRKEIFGLVFRLRREARKYHLLLTEEEEREEVENEDLARQSEALARTIESTI